MLVFLNNIFKGFKHHNRYFPLCGSLFMQLLQPSRGTTETVLLICCRVTVYLLIYFGRNPHQTNRKIIIVMVKQYDLRLCTNKYQLYVLFITIPICSIGLDTCIYAACSTLARASAGFSAHHVSLYPNWCLSEMCKEI